MVCHTKRKKERKKEMKEVKQGIVQWRENKFCCRMDIQKEWDNINGKKY
jgi:hypothetical protein